MIPHVSAVPVNMKPEHAFISTINHHKTHKSPDFFLNYSPAEKQKKCNTKPYKYAATAIMCCKNTFPLPSECQITPEYDNPNKRVFTLYNGGFNDTKLITPSGKINFGDEPFEQKWLATAKLQSNANEKYVNGLNQASAVLGGVSAVVGAIPGAGTAIGIVLGVVSAGLSIEANAKDFNGDGAAEKNNKDIIRLTKHINTQTLQMTNWVEKQVKSMTNYVDEKIAVTAKNIIISDMLSDLQQLQAQAGHILLTSGTKDFGPNIVGLFSTVIGANSQFRVDLTGYSDDERIPILEGTLYLYSLYLLQLNAISQDTIGYHMKWKDMKSANRCTLSWHSILEDGALFLEKSRLEVLAYYSRKFVKDDLRLRSSHMVIMRHGNNYEVKGTGVSMAILEGRQNTDDLKSFAVIYALRYSFYSIAYRLKKSIRGPAQIYYKMAQELKDSIDKNTVQ